MLTHADCTNEKEQDALTFLDNVSVATQGACLNEGAEQLPEEWTRDEDTCAE